MVFIMFLGPTGFFSFGGRRGPVVNHLDASTWNTNPQNNNWVQLAMILLSLAVSSSGIPIEAILPLSGLVYMFYSMVQQRSHEQWMNVAGQMAVAVAVFFCVYYIGLSNNVPTPRENVRVPEGGGFSFVSVSYPILFGLLLGLQAFPDRFYRAWFYTHRSIANYLPQRLRVFWNYVFGAFSSEIPTGSVPTAKSVIQNLGDIVLEEKHLLAEGAPYITCPVCLENMCLGDKVKRLACKHYFHSDCIMPWLQKHCTCPSCRHELPTDDPFYEEARRSRNRGVNANRSSEQERFTREGLLSYSVSELKSIARERGVNFDGVLEKRELVERIVQHVR